jgi:beta-galactosidase
MEDLGFGYGYVLYRTRLNRDYENVKLSVEDIGDRAHIYLNKVYIGTIYVNGYPYKIEFSAKAGDVLSILCENMGRTNYGPKMMKKKGIIGRCLIDGKIHFGWQAYHLPMDNLDKVFFIEKCEEGNYAGNCFYKFIFNVRDIPRDTFLRTDNFKKGFAVLNGFNLGRYWERGPQKTLYVPASVLKQGLNELIIFESDGLDGSPIVNFTNKHDLG